MARNRVQDGMVIQWTNGGTAVASGDPVVVGNLIGVALVDIANGESGSVAIGQVYNLPKVDAAVIAQGERVGFNAATDEVDDAAFAGASGDVLTFGVAFEAKGATTGESIAVLLTPGVGTVVP